MKWLLAFVGTHDVDTQVVAPWEILATAVTMKWLLACVDTHVDIQGRALCESRATDVTRKWLLTCVGTHVDIHFGVLWESLVAYVANLLVVVLLIAFLGAWVDYLICCWWSCVYRSGNCRSKSSSSGGSKGRNCRVQSCTEIGSRIGAHMHITLAWNKEAACSNLNLGLLVTLVTSSQHRWG